MGEDDTGKNKHKACVSHDKNVNFILRAIKSH
jgi:hypothetical protein